MQKEWFPQFAAPAFLARIRTDIPENAGYFADWLRPLKQDKREILRVAANAQKIVDMVVLEFQNRSKTQSAERLPFFASWYRLPLKGSVYVTCRIGFQALDD